MQVRERDAGTDVLVVEDDERVGSLVARGLESLGYAVSGLIATGEEVLRVVETHTPDLVLMDIRLAGEMDGVTAAERIHDRWDIPVIYMTGHSDDGTLARAQQTDPVGYVTKPVTPAALKSAIEIGLAHHRRERRLRESRELFRTYFEQAPLGYQSLDEEGCLLDVNPEWLRLTGYRREEVIGRWWGEFLSSEYRDLFPERFERFKQTGIIHDVVFEMLAKDGQRIIAAFDGRISRDSEGRFLRTHCVMRDITRRQQAEAALRSTNEVLTSLFNSSPLALFSVDADGKVLLWNPTAERLLGWQAEEAIGQFAPMVPEGMGEVFRRWIERTLEGEKLENRELDVISREGKILPVSLSMAPVRSSNGTVISAMGMLLDLSDRRRAERSRSRLEERLRDARQMETLGVLAGGIAHDYNNLLMTIIGNADLAMTESNPSGSVREDLEEIRRAAVKASDLTNQLLAYAGKGSLAMSRLDLTDFLRREQPRLDARTGACTLTLELPDQPLPVRGDSSQVQRAVENLVLNAAESLDGVDDGLTVRAERRMVSAEELREATGAELGSGEQIVLEVVDEGPGMCESTLEKVFDPFFSTKFTGRGMGLPAVLGVVRAHGGKVRVQSQLGSGTCVSLYFPPADRTETELVPPAPRPRNFRVEGTVLVADDDESVRRIARRLLSHFGLEVLQAVDGQEAVEIYRRHSERIDLCLVDVVMPRMGGVEVFEAIIRCDPDARVALVSGYAEPKAIHSLQRRGLVGFIQKPFLQSQLLSLLRSVFPES